MKCLARQVKYLYRQAGTVSSLHPYSRYALNGCLALRGKRLPPLQEQLMTEQRAITRKETTPINVWVTPGEKAQIDALARQTGHSMSSLLRCLGMGHQPPSILDSKMILELAKINGDQGRLGGLLKMWLTNDERFAGFDGVQMRRTIEVVLSRIQQTQQAMLDLVIKVQGE